MKRFVVLALAIVLSACGSSPPTQHYTLDPVPPQQGSQSSDGGLRVKVAAVHIPSDLDRQEIVREGASHQLDVSDQNRWSAALDQMIQRVLTQDLTQRLGSGQVVLPQEPASGPVATIVVDILQFERSASGTVIFDGSWSLMRAGSDKAALSRHVRLIETTASASYADQVDAMSRAVGVLAEQIAAALPGIGRKP